MIDPSSQRYRQKGMGLASPLIAFYGVVLRALLKKRPHILIACMPKSGSTYLCNILGEYAGIKRKKIVPVYDDREHELCEYRLMLHQASSYVAQLHLRHNVWTAEMARRYGLSQVVLVRNIYDCVASIRDHVLKEKNFGSIMVLPKNFEGLTQDEIDMAVARFAIPWYLSFYLSWKHGSGALFVTYDQLIESPAETVSQILTSARVKIDPSELSRAIERVNSKSKSRFNKGVSGRGASLSEAVRKEVRQLVATYPELSGDPLFAEPSQQALST